MNSPLFRVIRRWKWIFGASFGAALITFLLCLFVLPKKYEVYEVMLAPEVASASSPFLSFRNFGLQVPTGTVSSQAVYAILTSTRVKDRAIRDFNLLEEYELSTRGEAYALLDSWVRVDVDLEQGTITLRVRHKDPDFALRLLEAYNRYLDEVTEELNIGAERPIAPILDPPFRPDKPVFPRPKLFSAVAFLLVFFALSFGLLGYEYLKLILRELRAEEAHGTASP